MVLANGYSTGGGVIYGYSLLNGMEISMGCVVSTPCTTMPNEVAD